jgi:hypothetical protein
MQKRNTKAHRITVSDEDLKRDIYICVSYDMDEATQFKGFEFYKLVSSIPVPALSIPSSRQATFKEEIHILRSASKTDINGSGILEDRIQTFIEEAYDVVITTRLKEIDQNND